MRVQLHTIWGPVTFAPVLVVAAEITTHCSLSYSIAVPVMKGSDVMCAIDGSERSMAAVHFCCDHLLTSPCSRLAVTTIAATHDSVLLLFEWLS